MSEMESWAKNLRADSSTSSLDGARKKKTEVKKKRHQGQVDKEDVITKHANFERRTDSKNNSLLEISRLKTVSNEKIYGVRKSVSSEVLYTKERHSMKSQRTKTLTPGKMATEKPTLKPQYPSVPDIRKSSSMGNIYHSRVGFGKNKFHSDLKICRSEMEQSEDFQEMVKSLAG